MEIEAFATLVIPFILVVYGAVLLFLRPPRTVLLASLLGGLVAGVVNALFDLLAYYAHWWHYTLNGLMLHLPLPFYATPVLVYGSIAYLLIWRFRQGRGQWLARTLLVGIPLFHAATDISSSLVTSSATLSSYTHYDSPLAPPLDLLMWLLLFYCGYWLFRRLSWETPYVAPASEVEEKGNERA